MKVSILCWNNAKEILIFFLLTWSIRLGRLGAGHFLCLSGRYFTAVAGGMYGGVTGAKQHNGYGSYQNMDFFHVVQFTGQSYEFCAKEGLSIFAMEKC